MVNERAQRLMNYFDTYGVSPQEAADFLSAVVNETSQNGICNTEKLFEIVTELRETIR